MHYIRSSEQSNVALARELRISDVTIGKVRRGLIWTDQAGPRNRNDIVREAIIAMLVMAGLRVSELCGLQGRHIDLGNARIQITREITKTDAGVRTIPMVPTLHGVLLAHKVDRPYGMRDHVFPTRNGTANTPDNVRTHIIETAHARADKLLVASGATPIAHLTPHTLRRTFASILAEVGVPPRRAMYLLGHTNPRFTMSVYQQVLDLGDGGVERLETLLGGDAEQLLTVLSGRRPSAGVLTPTAG